MSIASISIAYREDIRPMLLVWLSLIYFLQHVPFDEIYGNILNDNDLKISHNPSVESLLDGGVFFNADHLLIVLWVSRIGSFPRSWSNNKNEKLMPSQNGRFRTDLCETHFKDYLSTVFIVNFIVCLTVVLYLDLERKNAKIIIL